MQLGIFWNKDVCFRNKVAFWGPGYVDRLEHLLRARPDLVHRRDVRAACDEHGRGRAAHVDRDVHAEHVAAAPAPQLLVLRDCVADNEVRDGQRGLRGNYGMRVGNKGT